MDKMKEDKLAADLEAEVSDDSAWEETAPSTGKRRDGLATQISVRLDPEQAARLRRIAADLGLGYTSLLRQWVDERLKAEDGMLLAKTRVQPAGTTLADNAQLTFHHTYTRRGVLESAA